MLGNDSYSFIIVFFLQLGGWFNVFGGSAIRSLVFGGKSLESSWARADMAASGGAGSRPPTPALTPTLSPARTWTLAPSAARGLLAGLGLGRWLTGDPGRRDTETAARNHPVPGGRAEGSPSFKIPGHKPSNFDKKFLLWTGRFKRIEDIPAVVSLETISAARNKMRVKGCFLMVVLSIIGCFAMVISGKKAARRHESLSAMNLDKKAKLKASQQAVPKSQ